MKHLVTDQPYFTHTACVLIYTSLPDQIPSSEYNKQYHIKGFLSVNLPLQPFGSW